MTWMCFIKAITENEAASLDKCQVIWLYTKIWKYIPRGTYYSVDFLFWKTELGAEDADMSYFLYH